MTHFYVFHFLISFAKRNHSITLFCVDILWLTPFSFQIPRIFFLFAFVCVCRIFAIYFYCYTLCDWLWFRAGKSPYASASIKRHLLSYIFESSKNLQQSLTHFYIFIFLVFISRVLLGRLDLQKKHWKETFFTLWYLSIIELLSFKIDRTLEEDEVNLSKWFSTVRISQNIVKYHTENWSKTTKKINIKRIYYSWP